MDEQNGYAGVQICTGGNVEFTPARYIFIQCYLKLCTCTDKPDLCCSPNFNINMEYTLLHVSQN